MKNIVNVSAYRFVELDKNTLGELKLILRAKCDELCLKGTILLAEEGINFNLAGFRENIDAFKHFLNQTLEFKDLFYKESFSEDQPFDRMRVRVKKEIITFNVPEVDPNKHIAPYISPEEFKKWYENGKDMFVLDTRNKFEVQMGTFKNAKELDIENFRDFPEALSKLTDEVKSKLVITFCTGGVRCEKAAGYMLQQGFKEVYQLEGGILNYFEQCGDAYYNGKCFVFDKRISLSV